MGTKTPEQISYNMKQVKSKDSKIEQLLRKELWSRGIRYRKNVRKVFGNPDITFIGLKIAVFCDSPSPIIRSRTAKCRIILKNISETIIALFWKSCKLYWYSKRLCNSAKPLC